MALHLILEDAAAAVEDGWPGLGGRYVGLPVHPGGFGWGSTAEDLFQDTDLLSVADPAEVQTQRRRHPADPARQRPPHGVPSRQRTANITTGGMITDPRDHAAYLDLLGRDGRI